MIFRRGLTPKIHAPWRGNLALPALSGVLLTLSMPPFALIPLPFVALVPFILWFSSLPGDEMGLRRATKGAVVLGTVYFGLTYYWLVVALIIFTKLALLAWLASVAILVTWMVIAMRALHRLRHRTQLPLWLTVPLFWVAMEWCIGHMGDARFPWLGLGMTLTAAPRLMGSADLWGTSGIAFWIACVNVLIAQSAMAIQRGKPAARHVVATIVVLILPMLYGVVRNSQVVGAMHSAGRIMLVQPNVEEEVKLGDDLGKKLAIEWEKLSRLTMQGAREAGEEKVDLVVWPEVALQSFPTRDASLVQAVQSVSRYAKAPVLFGALGVNADELASNSAFIVDSTGLKSWQYDKQYLVPIVERVPFMSDAMIRRFFGRADFFGGYVPGHSNEPVTVGGQKVGVFICYESIFSRLGVRYRRAGATLFVNITNDAWYGRHPWYTRTSALWQHPAHMVARAIETRTGVARAGNTGISEFVDPTGEVREATPLFEEAVKVGVVQTTSMNTLYVLLGDWVGWGSIVGSIGLAMWAAVRSKKRNHSL